MMFIKASSNSHGFVNARDIEDIWRDHFDYFYREYDEFIFVSHNLLPRKMVICAEFAAYHASSRRIRKATCAADA